MKSLIFFTKIVSKTILFFCVIIGVLLLFFVLHDKYKLYNKCKPSQVKIVGKIIQYPMNLKNAIDKYDLSVQPFGSAISDLKKDTVLLIRSRYAEVQKHTLSNNLYACIFYIKNPSSNQFNRIKATIENKFGQKFEIREYKFDKAIPNYFFYMKINDCTHISLKEKDYFLYNEYKAQNKNEHSCVISIYYDVLESDVENGTFGNGSLKEYMN